MEKIKDNKISVILCAYNEEKSIENVIFSLANSNVFDEIIVVNDGSTDNTRKIIESLKEKFDIIDIHFPKNKGKGYAMATGIEKANAEIIVFCDADLSGLKKEHFLQLVEPLLDNRADMVLGQPIVNFSIDYTYNPLKLLTGERALYKKDILPILEKIKTSRFGVETIINLYYKAHKKRVEMVLLSGLKHFIKFEKANRLQAMKQYLQAGHQITFTTVNNYGLISKIVKNKFNKILIEN
ncbi:MAG: glycosyltransferase family 2 protein [Bacteroidetes bacterium]|nr:MAG: glycosyltransferase family 2 protein [Bacteroidota bacterium]